MPKINQKEYDILKGLDDKWKWIARDGGVFERVCVYSKPPKKGGVCWGTVSPIDEWESLSMSNSFFQFIKWGDEEPHNIAELIEEYEEHLNRMYPVYNDQKYKDMTSRLEESEETEVKDLEWLKKWVEEYENKIIKELGDKFTDDFMTTRLHGGRSAVKEIKYRINQLDEPEVLSQEWIDGKTFVVTDSDGDDYAVVAHSALQNLLVPKQEEVDQAYKDGYEKGKEHATKVINPIIPKLVAEYIQEGHELGVDLGTALTIKTDRLDDIKKYIRDNEEVFVRAWLSYPNIEVEKQPQYRLKAGENYLYFNLDGTVRGATKDNATITNERLKQLPFDVEKAVESGIIEVEELEE